MQQTVIPLIAVVGAVAVLAGAIAHALIHVVVARWYDRTPIAVQMLPPDPRVYFSAAGRGDRAIEAAPVPVAVFAVSIAVSLAVTGAYAEALVAGAFGLGCVPWTAGDWEALFTPT